MVTYCKASIHTIRVFIKSAGWLCLPGSPRPWASPSSRGCSVLGLSRVLAMSGHFKIGH